jgi:hypothetical protein
VSGAWAHVGRCLDLREEDIAKAIETRESTRDLLARMAQVSSPDTGAAKVLLVLARMATTACAWLDGGLRVDLSTRQERTRVDVTTDLGGGLQERALPSIELAAPLGEFLRAIERVPRLVAPLVVARKSDAKLVLTASAQIRRTSIPPPPIAVAEESLFVQPLVLPRPPRDVQPESGPLPVVTPEGSASSKSPEDVDGGWDD